MCVNELAVQCVESVRLTSDESLRLFLQEDMFNFYLFFIKMVCECECAVCMNWQCVESVCYACELLSRV